MNKLINLLTLTQNDLINKYNITRKDGGILFQAKKDGLRPLLTCHLDTINTPYNKKLTKKDILFDGNKFYLSPKTNAQCLGGDDRCGVYIAEKLIPLNKYDILFTTDEEVGGIGVNKWIENNFDIIHNNKWSCIISLDRRSANNKNEFAVYGYDNEELNSIIQDMGYEKFHGSYTDGVDVASVTGIAMINISVGYDNEHSKNEVIYIERMFDTLELLKNENFYKKITKKVFHFEIEKEDWYKEYECICNFCVGYIYSDEEKIEVDGIPFHKECYEDFQAIMEEEEIRKYWVY